MAEFCEECFKAKIAIPSDNITDDMLVMSDEPEFCEGCGEIKPVVVVVMDGSSTYNTFHHTPKKSYLEKALEDAKKFNKELGDKTFDN